MSQYVREPWLSTLLEAARDAFIDCHDRAYWHDSNRSHSREWDDCGDELCVERRAALTETSDSDNPDENTILLRHEEDRSGGFDPKTAQEHGL